MLLKNSWALMGSIVFFIPLQSQVVFRDTLPTDTAVNIYNLFFNIPVGQTFLSKHHCSGYSIFKAWTPTPGVVPSVQVQKVNEDYSCYFSWGSPSGSNSEATFVENSQQGRQMRNSITNLEDHGDPSKFIMDLKADPSAPINLQMNLGSGSTRLDLSGLFVNSVDISTGETDVILSFSEPNSCRMKELKIKAGMSGLLLRNLEFARADNIRIENGMGSTMLVLGGDYSFASRIYIEVGAGSCEIHAGENVPLKITLENSGMAVPEGFFKAEENVFVNSAFKTKPSAAIQIFVDLGVGTLKVFTDRQ